MIKIREQNRLITFNITNGSMRGEKRNYFFPDQKGDYGTVPGK